MTKCSIYDNSLRFSRAIYGVLALISFLVQSHWLILITAIIMILGAFSIKLNIFYQFYSFFLEKKSKKEVKVIKKDVKELTFACGMGGGLLLISFLLLYFERSTGFAWTLVLITSFLMFLAGIANICVAALVYAIFKKPFKNEE